MEGLTHSAQPSACVTRVDKRERYGRQMARTVIRSRFPAQQTVLPRTGNSERKRGGPLTDSGKFQVTHTSGLTVSREERGHAILKIVESYRELAGLTNQGSPYTLLQISEMAGQSLHYVGKQVRGKRAISAAFLAVLVDTMGMSPEVIRHLVELSADYPDAYWAPVDEGAPTGRELSELQHWKLPAALLTRGTYDIRYINTAAERVFPRLADAGNLIRWILLDPISKVVLGKSWSPVARYFVPSFHFLSLGVVPDIARGAAIADLRAAPEFDDLWKLRPGRNAEIFPLAVEITDPGALHETRSMSVNLGPSSEEMTHWKVTLTPAE